MTEKCIGYCEEKTGPLFQHPEFVLDKLCGPCLVSWWEEDLERYHSDMGSSIAGAGQTCEALLKLDAMDNDEIGRLVHHAAYLSVDLRDNPDCVDGSIESFRALPDHLQAAINDKSEAIDKENQLEE